MVRSFYCDARLFIMGFCGEGFPATLQGSEITGEHPRREQSLDAAACQRAAMVAVLLLSLSDARMNVLSSRETTTKKGISVSVSLVS